MTKHFCPTLVALAVGLAAPSAYAGAQQGVRCPSGFTAEISDGARTLVCRKTARYELASICSPLAISEKGISVGGNVVMEPTGSDMCLAAVTGKKVPSVAAPPPPNYPPISAFTRQINDSGPDKFVASRSEFAYPEAGPIYIGDSSKGVSCPSGYDGDKVFDGRGIRCDKLDGSPKPADCDGIATGLVAIGWKWQQDYVGAEDRCLPMGGGSQHGPTKPQGMTKAQHDAERASDSIGWILNARPGARDTWQRKVYAFPAKN
jgi:hypothetical protein